MRGGADDPTGGYSCSARITTAEITLPLLPPGPPWGPSVRVPACRFQLSFRSGCLLLSLSAGGHYLNKDIVALSSLLLLIQPQHLRCLVSKFLLQLSLQIGVDKSLSPSRCNNRRSVGICGRPSKERLCCLPVSARRKAKKRGHKAVHGGAESERGHLSSLATTTYSIVIS